MGQVKFIWKKVCNYSCKLANIITLGLIHYLQP